jgi:transposase InsO family protein
MPWKEQDTMSLRREFVLFASDEGVNRRELCRRYGISPTTGYKWLRRYRELGESGLEEHSRRPLNSPRRTPDWLESRVIEIRDDRGWGSRKIRWKLSKEGAQHLPSTSTITGILNRHGRISPGESAQRKPFRRFEAKAPNALVQMDFKGHFQAGRRRCHPLTVLDDHSRFSLALEACLEESRATVQECLTRVFRRYGLPDRMLVDNGSPWGSREPVSGLAIWLMRLGIRVIHARPAHPQTLGKDERFHRTLVREVLRRQHLQSLRDCQSHFDQWRDVYNFERPHESLGMEVPASRYRPSTRPFPEPLPPIEYGDGLIVRRVHGNGEIWFHDRVFKISKGLRDLHVGIKPTNTDGVFQVYFCHQLLRKIDLTDHPKFKS